MLCYYESSSGPNVHLNIIVHRLSKKFHIRVNKLNYLAEHRSLIIKSNCNIQTERCSPVAKNCSVIKNVLKAHRVYTKFNFVTGKPELVGLSN